MLGTLPPLCVVTITLAVPALPPGVVAVMLVELVTLKLEATTPPKVTEVVPVKLVPVIVMTVPPARGPVDGEILVMVGSGAGDALYS